MKKIKWIKCHAHQIHLISARLKIGTESVLSTTIIKTLNYPSRRLNGPWMSLDSGSTHRKLVRHGENTPYRKSPGWVRDRNPEPCCFEVTGLTTPSLCGPFITNLWSLLVKFWLISVLCVSRSFCELHVHLEKHLSLEVVTSVLVVVVVVGEKWHWYHYGNTGHSDSTILLHCKILKS